MRDKHWTDDALISKLFEVGPEDNHLEACPECARRWDAVRQKFESDRAVSAAVSEGKLTAQRQAVRDRLKGTSRGFRPAPAYSAAVVLLLVVIALIFFRLNTPQPPAPQIASEDPLLEEVYQMSSSAEPSAIEPFQSLFEEQQ